MEEEIKLKPSEELAYWTGVVQSDGYCLVRGKSVSLSFGIAKKSLPMLIKFYDISKSLLDRRSSPPHELQSGEWIYWVTITEIFKQLVDLKIRFSDPPAPPKWTLEKPGFLGAYLAGVIDGDGDIRIKRPKYPQCAIRISSGSPQIELQDAIKEKLKCSTSISKVFRSHIIEGGRTIKGTVYKLEFLVSSKTINFSKEFLLPWVQLPHKREKIESYLMIRGAN